VIGPGLAVLLGGLAGAGGPAAPPRAAPAAVTIRTARGDSQLAVTTDLAAGPVLAGGPLLGLLGGSMRPAEAWMEITLDRQSFRFLLGAPYLAFNDRLQPLAGFAFQRNDSLYLPLQFVTEVLPRVLAERYQWDPRAARLAELGPRLVPQPAPPAATAPTTAASTSVPAPKRLPNGLLPGHVITVDAGHGGDDPGNPGYFFPRGRTEKHINLQVALLLRDELKRRGIKVVMTRTTDTLIALRDRGGYCTAECDLFVSIHVNSLTRRRGSTATRGFETWILGEENTEDADRVARMENEALRFEGLDPDAATGGLDFILRDLQMNEYLRESARAAALIEETMQPVHSGGSRGVKQSNQLAVLNTARRPAVLVEIGFSSNPDDARLMVNRKSQTAMAYAIADALVAYLLEYERKTGSGSDGGGR
jgi:N-acetylmuramoyl-L-alanine amidase